MSHILYLSDKLHVTPLFDIRHEEVASVYGEGLDEQLHRRHELLPISYLVTSFQQAIADSSFDGRHQTAARKFVGYLFGKIHGTVIGPTGSVFQEVATLAASDTKDARRGYLAGRHFFFYEATPQERRMTDDDLIDRLHEIAQECTAWHDPDEVWQYAIACILGELSGLIFPVTLEERAYWEAQDREAQAWIA